MELTTFRNLLQDMHALLYILENSFSPPLGAQVALLALHFEAPSSRLPQGHPASMATKMWSSRSTDGLQSSVFSPSHARSLALHRDAKKQALDAIFSEPTHYLAERAPPPRPLQPPPLVVGIDPKTRAPIVLERESAAPIEPTMMPRIVSRRSERPASLRACVLALLVCVCVAPFLRVWRDETDARAM